MTNMYWEDPPGIDDADVRKAGVVSFEQEAARLRARPGQWAVIRPYPLEQGGTARTIGTRIRAGAYPAFRPAGEWECVTRTRGGQVLVYARYIGENGEYRDVRKPGKAL